MGTELASLDAEHPTEEQLREAVWVLTGHAIDATGGDLDAAVDAMRLVAEAIGARPYEPAEPRGMWGRPQQQGRSE